MNDLLAPNPPEHRTHEPEAEDPAGTALTTARDVTAEIFRLLQTTAAQATNGWSLATLMRSVVPELEQIFSSRETLQREAQELRARAVAAEESLREMEGRLATCDVGWRAERAALEADAAREQDQARVLAEDLERRRTELDMLEGRTRRLREQMEGIAARAHADREETLRLAREMVQSAEDARIAVLDEMEALRSALVAEQGEQARASQGAAEREAELVRTRQLLEQLEASRASTAAELARVRASLVHAEGELLAAQHEYQLAQVQIDRLLGAHDDLVEDRAQLTAKLHDSDEREARLRLRITGLEQRILAVRDGERPDDVVVEPAAAAESPQPDPRIAGLAASLSRTEERARALEHELAVVKAGAGAASARFDTLQDQHRATERARAAADARATAGEGRAAAAEQRADALQTAVETLERARPEAARAPAPVPVDPRSIEPDGGDAPEDVEPASADPSLEEPECDVVALELETAAVDVEVVESDSSAPIAAGPLRSVAVLDASTGWDHTTDVDAEAVPPAPEAVARLRALDPGCLLVNLATPGVLATALALRTDGVSTPLWACIVGPSADSGIALGPFDVIARPVDPDRVQAELEPLVPRGANVIMVGTESATLIPLRQGLLRIGASVRTAWTIAQATDLARSATPDLVIVDLAADQTGIADFVVDLACREVSPALVVVAGAIPTLDAFGEALAVRGAAAGPSGRAQLVRAAGAGRPRAA